MNVSILFYSALQCLNLIHLDLYVCATTYLQKCFRKLFTLNTSTGRPSLANIWY